MPCCTIPRIDGFWNFSLHDPNNFGGKETTGTALFIYGMAWGVNHGLLNLKNTCLPLSKDGMPWPTKLFIPADSWDIHRAQASSLQIGSRLDTSANRILRTMGSDVFFGGK